VSKKKLFYSEERGLYRVDSKLLKKHFLALSTLPVEQPHPHPPLVVPEDVGTGKEQGSVAHKDFVAGVGRGPSSQAALLQVCPHRYLRHNAAIFS